MGGPDDICLVDGLYLALNVLASWKFEALGRQLTLSDVHSLDMYLKKCKHGPATFRINRALQLSQDGSHQAIQELEKLRSKAVERLKNVKRVQRHRDAARNTICNGAAAAKSGGKRPTRSSAGGRAGLGLIGPMPV